MINEITMNRLIDPIVEIYNDLEYALIDEIAKRLLNYDGDFSKGVLQWYTDKLNDLGGLNGKAIQLIAQKTGKTPQEIKKMLEQAGYANIDMNVLNQAFNQGMIADPALLMQSKVVKDIINNSYVDLNKTFKLINTKAIQGTNQAYMNALNKAYIEVASGVYDYNTAIKKALYEMAEQGIKVVEYRQPNGTIRKYGIEACVRRDTLTAVFQTANKVALEGAKDLGTEHVEVSSHLGARTGDGVHPFSDHASWQGKVYKIQGADEYPNLVEVTGYGHILGLGGVNCRHRMFPFYKGISKPYAIQYDPAENQRVYDATQKQRALERKLRSLRKREVIAKNVLAVDPSAENSAELKKIQTAIADTKSELDAHVSAHDFLKRHYERERIV